MASVLYIAQRVPYPPNKGEKLRSFYQIKHLAARGHRITVYCLIEDAQDEKDADLLATELNIEVKTFALKSKLLRYISACIKGQSFSEANFQSKALQRALHGLSDAPDALVFTASSLVNYAKHLNLPKRPTLIMDFMDVDSDKWTQYANRSHFLMRAVYQRESRLVKRLEKQVASSFDLGFLIAETECKIFKSSVSDMPNLEVLGNGIDRASFIRAQEPDISKACEFLFTGVMDYKPNIDAIIWFVEHCWNDIKKAVPKARLTIAGMNPSDDITQLAKDPQIEVTGFVEDIMPYFTKAHIFIAPFQIARGVQNKVLQAMSCKIAIVSTALGAEGILSEDKGNMLIADTAHDFYERCVELAKDTSLREQIAEQAEQTIKTHYAWESVLQPLVDAIEQ